MKRIIVQSLVLMSVLFLWTGMAEASEEIVGAGQEEASIEDAQGEDLQDASDLIDEALDEELAYQKNIETEAEEASVYQENIETGAEEATLYVRAAAKSGKWVLNRTGWWFAYKDGTWPMGEIVEINGTRYGFNEAGYMVTGWYLDGSGWYYFNADGSMYSGWLLSSNTWYYLDDADVDCPGRMLSDCEKEIRGNKYFFASSGSLLVGWVLRPEGWYYADASGAAQKGWLLLGNAWYYLDGNNAEYPCLMTAGGWQMIDGQYYYLTGSGAMASNWLLIEEGWYYLGMDGARKTGWQMIGGIWYYLDGENAEYPGLMVNDGWQMIGGQYYYLTGSGAMASNWLLFEEGWYYLGADGARKTGWQMIGGSWYYFYQKDDPNGGIYGVMATSGIIDGWKITESGVAVYDIQGKIEEIKKYITVPYVYGGTTTSGWDCSGFTQWALYYLGGVTIPRTTTQQAVGGVNIYKDDMSVWKPGDVLVYSSRGSYTHVALYLGDGMLMHALNYKYGTLIQGVEYYEQWDSGNVLALVRRYL